MYFTPGQLLPLWGNWPWFNLVFPRRYAGPTNQQVLYHVCEDVWKLIQMQDIIIQTINWLVENGGGGGSGGNYQEQIDALKKQLDAIQEKLDGLQIPDGENITEIVENIVNQYIDDSKLTEITKQFFESPEGEALIKQYFNEFINGDEFVSKVKEIIEQYLSENPDITNVIKQAIQEFLQSPEGQKFLEQLISQAFMKLVPGATLDHIATFDNAGQVKDGGKTLTEFKVEVVNELLGGDDENSNDKDETITNNLRNMLVTYVTNGQADMTQPYSCRLSKTLLSQPQWILPSGKDTESKGIKINVVGKTGSWKVVTVQSLMYIPPASWSQGAEPIGVGTYGLFIGFGVDYGIAGGSGTDQAGYHGIFAVSISDANLQGVDPDKYIDVNAQRFYSYAPGANRVTDAGSAGSPEENAKALSQVNPGTWFYVPETE